MDDGHSSKTTKDDHSAQNKKSALQHSQKLPDDIASILTCSVCLEVMSRPIILCRTGHSMCAKCVRSLTSCPECRGPITQTRNYQLEQLSDTLCRTVTVPCQFRRQGCPRETTLADRTRHEAECKHRRFGCEVKNFCGKDCGWVGNYRDLEKHFGSSHAGCVEEETEKVFHVNLIKDFRYVSLVSYRKRQEYFWYKYMVDVDKRRVYWAVQYIGPQKEAGKFGYQLEISKADCARIFEETCTNDVTDPDRLFEAEDCAWLTFRTVEKLSDGSGRLTIKLKVMELDQ